MLVTRLDCHFFRGKKVRPDQSSYVLFNPAGQAGTLALGVSCAARESLGGQVACKLSLDHFVDGALEYFDAGVSKAEKSESQSDPGLQILESAFRKANSSVYSFGHKLAAGGRMAATLLGLVLQGDLIAAGRAGGGGAYLYRAGELFPFFAGGEPENKTGVSEDVVGKNSLVSVELASVPAQEGDIIFVFGNALSAEMEGTLLDLAKDTDFTAANPCWEIAQFLFEDPDQIPVAMVAQLGPAAIYLDTPMVANGD